MSEEIKKVISWIKKNWERIPDKSKVSLFPGYKYCDKTIKNVKKEGHFVVLLLDRQKPSVDADYDFDEERLGVNRFGEIIWGFDSGCSCPIPWDDSFPDCYESSRTWKEFKVNLKDFDKDLKKEVLEEFEKIKTASSEPKVQGGTE